jgi:hypothetical protein
VKLCREDRYTVCGLECERGNIVVVLVACELLCWVRGRKVGEVKTSTSCWAGHSLVAHGHGRSLDKLARDP